MSNRVSVRRLAVLALLLAGCFQETIEIRKEPPAPILPGVVDPVCSGPDPDTFFPSGKGCKEDDDCHQFDPCYTTRCVFSCDPIYGLCVVEPAAEGTACGADATCGVDHRCCPAP